MIYKKINIVKAPPSQQYSVINCKRTLEEDSIGDAHKSQDMQIDSLSSFSTSQQCPTPPTKCFGSDNTLMQPG
jgi:hypothetical protein